MILVIIAVLMTDTINTLTRTTDSVVTVVKEKHTLMLTHTKYSAIVSSCYCCFCNSPVAADPLHPTISDGVCEQLTTMYTHVCCL